MEFFEKAHVSKRSPLKKDKRSEEIVKKQLKQMLHGYKQSDNELIKSSENAYRDISDVHRVHDDSASVSGFSDLDLTKSEDEEDIIPLTSSEVCDDDISTSSQLNLNSSNSLDSANSDDTIPKYEQDLLEPSGDYLEPISECDEDIESLPEDVDLTESSSKSDISLSKFAVSSQSMSSDTGSEEFDPDGSLAYKIKENLSKIKNNDNPDKKKRKLEDIPYPETGRYVKKTPKNKKTKTNLLKTANDINMENLSMHDDNEHSIENLMDNNTQDSISTNMSSQFISVTATEMSDHSLTDILGEYKHPTVRNLSFEKQQSSENNTSIFSTDDNMQVEDVDSLIPEIGEDPVIEDIEIELDTTADTEKLTDKGVQKTKMKDSQDKTKELNEPKKNMNPVRVYYTDTCCIFVLKHPAKLYVNGKVTLKPLGGQVEVFGHILKEEINLYSPNNSFAQCLQTLETENIYYGLFGRLTSIGLSIIEAEEIVTSLGEYDGVVAMTPLQDPKMEFVDNHFTNDVFKKLKVDSTANRLARASEMLSCNIYITKPVRSFDNFIAWDEDLSWTLKKCSRGIICGGKGLGKSTLMRYYINKVLENGPVLLVDLDPGQSEFTVAGNISATVVTSPLLGPSFTHLKAPNISYYVGTISVMDNLARFSSAVVKLIEQCCTQYSTMPWIINTMGMTNFTGLRLILLTIIHAKPTFLIQIHCKVTRKCFEYSLEPQALRMIYDIYRHEKMFLNVVFPEDLDYKFVTTPPFVAHPFKQDTSLSPKEERYLNFLAHFGELMVIHRGQNILGIIPYEIKLSDINVVTTEKIADNAVLNVINGKIVALCQINTTDKGKLFTLQDNSPLYHGNGLIRGVGFNTNTLYLLTPVPAERLNQVNAIVYASWAPDLLNTEKLLPRGKRVPYRAAAHHQNQHMITPRRRFNPLQLLKMSRSS